MKWIIEEKPNKKIEELLSKGLRNLKIKGEDE